MRESVLLEIEDHVAVVTLNREHKYNALDFAMFGALAEVGDRTDLPAMQAYGPSYCAAAERIFARAWISACSKAAFSMIFSNTCSRPPARRPICFNVPLTSGARCLCP